MDLLKKTISFLPAGVQDMLKRYHYSREIRKGRFHGGEPEFDRLDEMLKPGDWAIDVGANIGHYTNRMSELVGAEGRVIAFEPVPTTFAHLVNNMTYSRYQNITLVNGAASSETMVTGMTLPDHDTGLKNFYMAKISSDTTDVDYSILCLSIDSMALSHPVALMKIDAEGHEPAVIEGAMQTIERDRPTIIIETITDDIRNKLQALGYTESRAQGSPNVVFTNRAV